MKAAWLQGLQHYKSREGRGRRTYMSSFPPTKKARKVAPRIQAGIYKESKTSRGIRTQNVGVGKPTAPSGASARRMEEPDIEMEDGTIRLDPFEPDRRFIPTLDEIRARYGKVIVALLLDEHKLTTHFSDPKRLHARIFE